MAIYASPSDQFNSRSNRTMTGKCRRWTRMPQGGNMPILLKTWVECTAKTPLPRRRTRGGGLCGFRGAAERVPAGSPKTGRCADVRECCRNAKSRKRTSASEFRQREKPQTAKQEKRLGAFLRQPVHFCPQCGQFRGMKMALFCGC